MNISRRAFLDLCKSSAIGLGAFELVQLSKVLANPNAPTVLWLQGAACTGCSVSLLNRISTSAPTTVADLLVNTINLAYHPNLMGAAGQSAANLLVTPPSNYILVVEGGVPTAFGGAACWAYSSNGTDVTFLSAVQALGAKATSIVALGTCAAYGGIPHTGANPAGIQSVSSVLAGKKSIQRSIVNIPGCPAHPDWIVWAIAKLLTNRVGRLDSNGRPLALFGKLVHDQCPRLPSRTTENPLHTTCTEPWGCLGPYTYAPCPVSGWNNGVSWCVDVDSICIGCTEPTFPTSSLRRASPSGNYCHSCHSF